MYTVSVCGHLIKITLCWTLVNMHKMKGTRASTFSLHWPLWTQFLLHNNTICICNNITSHLFAWTKKKNKYILLRTCQLLKRHCKHCVSVCNLGKGRFTTPIKGSKQKINEYWLCHRLKNSKCWNKQNRHNLSMGYWQILI